MSLKLVLVVVCAAPPLAAGFATTPAPRRTQLLRAQHHDVREEPRRQQTSEAAFSQKERHDDDGDVVRREDALEGALRKALQRGDARLWFAVERKASDDAVAKAFGRAVALKKGRVLQVTFKRRGACDVVRNFDFDDLSYVELRETLFDDAKKATLRVSTEREQFLVRDRRLQESADYPFVFEYERVGRQRPKRRKRRAETTAELQKTLAHDRRKRRVLDDDAPFLARLGLTDATTGLARPGRDRKLAQVRRFVELLSQFAPADTTRVVDLGSGRGYLTFAAHHYFAKQLRQSVDVVGVERLKALVDEANALSSLSGEGPTEGDPSEGGPRFLHADIADVGSLNEKDDGSVLVMALHACDTATDDALFAAVEAGAAVVLASPCCHKELRPQLERRVASLRRRQDLTPGESALLELGRHGLVLTKTTELVTDTLRSLLLEIAGYDSKMLEWIGDEHTPRNTMLVATKRRQRDNSERRLLGEQRLRDIAAYYGITSHRLATCLGLGELLCRPSSSSSSDAAEMTREGGLLLTETMTLPKKKKMTATVSHRRMAPSSSASSPH